MNQILQTKSKKKINKLTPFLKTQFYISFFIFAIIIFYLIFSLQKLYKNESYSNSILSNYNLTRLYSNTLSEESNDSNDFFTITENSIDGNSIIGIIEIKSINLYYPVFSSYSDESLKISPCRFYGPEPGKTGNICILGHNYNNNKFFSKVNLLNKDDEIILYNNSQKVFSYFVENVYEVKNDDFSPIYDYDKNKKQLTLITCNNINNNRIIVRAICN